MTATAIDMLSDEDLLKQARAEWEERTAGAPYQCPIPPLVERHSRKGKKAGVLLGLALHHSQQHRWVAASRPERFAAPPPPAI